MNINDMLQLGLMTVSASALTFFCVSYFGIWERVKLWYRGLI